MRLDRSCLVGLFGLLLIGLGLLVGRSEPKSAVTATAKGKLAVLVVIDQFRGDYLQRWGHLFGAGGFRRLMTQGAHFTDCHYPYANTMTGPGHATLATGCVPAKHGIVANDWYDRRSGVVYCASLPRYRQTPPSLGRTRGGPTPERLLSPTLADALKEATHGQGRVVALSLKDRSSVLPGGRRPDACYWVDGEGRFVTSTYYRERPHEWVTAFNRSGAADRWLGATWDKLRPDLDYERYSGPDDAPGEGKGVYQGRSFPHPLDGGPRKSKRDYYSALANSPFGNDLLLALTRRAIEEEKLGRHGSLDLLSVSFSSNDLIGHTWGPDSQEVLDVTLRTDRVIEELLDLLDAKVGRDRYTLVLSADHGVCPLPEASRAKGREAQRIAPDRLRKGAEEHLNQMFPAKSGERGSGQWIESSVSNMLYLNRKLLLARGAEQAKVEKALATWLAAQPGIHSAWTRTELLAGRVDEIGERVRSSFHPERSGDVMLVLKPYHLLGGTLASGTNHGTPHDYDTHVPLLVFGPGVKPGVRGERISPEVAPVVLAKALGIAPPRDARFAVPEGLFAGSIINPKRDPRD
jgi:hypothetical protein